MAGAILGPTFTYTIYTGTGTSLEPQYLILSKPLHSHLEIQQQTTMLMFTRSSARCKSHYRTSLSNVLSIKGLIASDIMTVTALTLPKPFFIARVSPMAAQFRYYHRTYESSRPILTDSFFLFPFLFCHIIAPSQPPLPPPHKTFPRTMPTQSWSPSANSGLYPRT